jgi:eukaryotic-like serine/threonine-protein kinase
VLILCGIIGVSLNAAGIFLAFSGDKVVATGTEEASRAAPEPAAPAPAPAPAAAVSAAPKKSEPSAAPDPQQTVRIQIPVAPFTADRYKLGDRLGEGDSYLAQAEGRTFVLHRSRAVMDGELDKLLVRARAASTLKHPHIVPVHEILQSADEVVIVYEFVEGATLAQRLAEYRKLPWAECKVVAAQIARALEHAHAQGVIHQDLNPSHVMIARDGSAHVMGLGLSHKGTPAYMAPEQHKGARTKSESDYFALGVTLYEMATGEKPFKGPDFLAQKEGGKYAPASSLAPIVGERGDQLLASCFSVDLAQRPCGRLANELDNI